MQVQALPLHVPEEKHRYEVDSIFFAFAAPEPPRSPRWVDPTHRRPVTSKAEYASESTAVYERFGRR